LSKKQRQQETIVDNNNTCTENSHVTPSGACYNGTISRLKCSITQHRHYTQIFKHGTHVCTGWPKAMTMCRHTATLSESAQYLIDHAVRFSHSYNTVHQPIISLISFSTFSSGFLLCDLCLCIFIFSFLLFSSLFLHLYFSLLRDFLSKWFVFGTDGLHFLSICYSKMVFKSCTNHLSFSWSLDQSVCARSGILSNYFGLSLRIYFSETNLRWQEILFYVA